MSEKQRIVWPGNTRLKELRPTVNKILEAVGHPEAYVSDRSRVSDFFLDMDEKDTHAALQTVSDKLGVDIGEKDLLIEVAERLPADK